ncbi:MAG: hypothetical protein EHM61_19380 [Acidobacteria bacterium]|nr:MAG: hypothetical protein EHM61_19380 [Acidobacteriota bacterium]
MVPRRPQNRVCSADRRGYQVLVVDADGGVPQRVTTEPFASLPWPNWSADGRSIYFRSNRDGMSRIWKAPAEGGEAVARTSSDSDPATSITRREIPLLHERLVRPMERRVENPDRCRGAD